MEMNADQILADYLKLIQVYRAEMPTIRVRPKQVVYVLSRNAMTLGVFGEEATAVEEAYTLMRAESLEVWEQITPTRWASRKSTVYINPHEVR